MQKMIIAIGTQNDPNENRYSGQSTMFDGLVCHLRTLGHVVDIIDIWPKITIGRVVGKFSFMRAVEYIRIVLKLFWLLLTNTYGVAYIHIAQSRVGFYRDEVFIKILKLFHLEIVAHQFGANYSGFYNSLSPSLKKRLIKTLKTLNKVVVEGDYMKSQFSFLDDYEERVIVVPNGLPIESNIDVEAKTYEKGTPFKLIYLSHMIYSKGYFDVLKAVDLLVNKHNRKIKCVFAGQILNSVDDPFTREIRTIEQFYSYIDTHRLSDIIEYHEGLYGREKASHFSQSHVFLLPTYYVAEGQPLSILEAMAYGNVPIVTKYRHIPMMVSEETGYFVQPSSPEEIVAAIIEMMDNPHLYHAKSFENIKVYREKFTFDRYCNQLVSLLHC